MAQEARKHQLLVEGEGDRHAIMHLLRRHGWNFDRQEPLIKQLEGFNNLRAGLTATLLQSVRVLSVVIDADESPASRWQSIRDRLRELELVAPEEPVPDGWVAPTGIRTCERIGVWIMPDNKQQGTLENFVHTLVPEGDPCWPHALQATRAAAELGAPFKPQYCSKAELHTWLAWQEEPGKSIGQSITKKVLGADSELALRFVDWFKRLFGP